MPGMQPNLLTRGEVATRLGISRERVRALEKEGRLHPFRTERGVRLFDPAEINALADHREEIRRNGRPKVLTMDEIAERFHNRITQEDPGPERLRRFREELEPLKLQTAKQCVRVAKLIPEARQFIKRARSLPWPGARVDDQIRRDLLELERLVQTPTQHSAGVAALETLEAASISDVNSWNSEMARICGLLRGVDGAAPALRLRMEMVRERLTLIVSAMSPLSSPSPPSAGPHHPASNVDRDNPRVEL